MIISRKSLSYRLATITDVDSQINSLCSYSWAVLKGALLAFIFTFIAGMCLTFIPELGAWALVSLQFGYLMPLSELGFFWVIMLSIVGIMCLCAYVQMLLASKTSKASIVNDTYAALTDKYCIKINFVK
jgi:hypothetical protein